MDPVTGQLMAVLQEGFEGPRDRWSYFTDHGVDAGLFGTLARITPVDASRLAGGTSIAAHVHHLTFGLHASSAWIRGERASRDWHESWRVVTVDPAAWEEMLADLRRGYDDLKQAIEGHAASSVDATGGAIGAVAHLAYHLGAIRQKVAFLRPS
jgi:hypothetical protein